MAKPIKELEIRLGQLNLNGHCVQNMDWPNSIKVDNLHADLENVDPLYDKNISNLADIKKTSILQELFDSNDHVEITPHYFEIRFCGKNDKCDIWKYIGQQVSTPVTSKSDPCKQILQFHTLPINSPNR
eukprot:6053888-Ditylum_brightwellii.AAC.1